MRANRPHRVFSGDHIRKVIPVPIPNTEVKLSEPMIVHTSVKVGIAGFLKPLVNIVNKGFFRFHFACCSMVEWNERLLLDSLGSASLCLPDTLPA